MPYLEPSRPMPHSFMPPNGATSVEMMPFIDADDAVLERLGDPPDPADVAAVEIGGEAELGVVGHPDRLLFRVEAEQRGDRAEGLLARRPSCRCDTSASTVGWKKVPPSEWRSPPTTTRAPLDRASPIWSSTFSTAAMSISGPCCGAFVRAVGHLQRLDRVGQLGRRRRRRRRLWTSMRLAQTQVWPVLRYFEAMAPVDRLRRGRRRRRR